MKTVRIPLEVLKAKTAEAQKAMDLAKKFWEDSRLIVGKSERIRRFNAYVFLKQKFKELDEELQARDLEGKKYFNHTGYSDVNVYEIIRVVSETCLEVRKMDAEALHTADDLGWIQGGFSFIATTQDNQRWKMKSNPNYQIERIRLHKDNKWYISKNCYGFISPEPHYYYDYNF